MTAPSETAGVPIASALRRSLATSTAWYSLTSTRSGMTSVRGSGGGSAGAAPRGATAT